MRTRVHLFNNRSQVKRRKTCTPTASGGNVQTVPREVRRVAVAETGTIKDRLMRRYKCLKEAWRCAIAKVAHRRMCARAHAQGDTANAMAPLVHIDHSALAHAHDSGSWRCTLFTCAPTFRRLLACRRRPIVCAHVRARKATTRRLRLACRGTVPVGERWHVARAVHPFTYRLFYAKRRCLANAIAFLPHVP